jgi:hypothetical protein
MFQFKLVFILSSVAMVSFSQNDLDAIRYAHTGIGGTSRFISMGGAFGAVGANVTTSAYNPAGLAVFRKGEISFSTGFKVTNNTASIYKKSSTIADLNVVFNNFGFVAAWPSGNGDNRNIFSFSSTQLQNFNSSTRMSGYTNSSSIAKDMYNLAEGDKSNGGVITNNLYSNYEGLAFNTYLLYTANNKFFSMLDLKRTVKQTRDLETSGRVNDINLSFAHAFEDKFYLGVSLGIPQVKYESTTTHVESDDRDSMRVVLIDDSTFSSTYIDDIPVLRSYYDNKLGFNSLEYIEYFKTTGSGINLKLGGIVRVNDLIRVGFYYHTPTIYRLQDSYYNSLSVSFDADPKNPSFIKDPEAGGVYKYRMITPGKVSANVAFIIKKLAVIAIDYEMVNYQNAQLKGDNISDFESTNSIIKEKYKAGHNLRIGSELNLNPFMIRVGYNMQGSPFGNAFTGDFVKNTFSGGFGFKTESGFYFDFVIYQTRSNDNYIPFITMDTEAKIKYNSTTVAATIGIKF